MFFGDAVTVIFYSEQDVFTGDEVIDIDNALCILRWGGFNSIFKQVIKAAQQLVAVGIDHKWRFGLVDRHKHIIHLLKDGNCLVKHFKNIELFDTVSGILAKAENSDAMDERLSICSTNDLLKRSNF
jgi:hypothetical protein